jgi:Holliday junction resolvase-like predicted endonuclease
VSASRPPGNRHVSVTGHDPRVDGQVKPRSRTAAQRLGDDAEALVAERLVAQGWSILARNVHVGRHELDLVAVDPGPPRRLVVVEVRLRTSRRYGLAEETVDFRKRRHLRDAAWTMVAAGSLPDGRPLPGLNLRFDIVVVEPDPPRMRHYRGAF